MWRWGWIMYMDRNVRVNVCSHVGIWIVFLIFCLAECFVMVWIKKCLLNDFCWRGKVCGCIFFVLWYPPLHRCTAGLSRKFLRWLCTLRFSVGSFLVGGMFLYPNSSIVCWDECYCGGFHLFCCGFLWFVQLQLSFILFLLKISAGVVESNYISFSVFLFVFLRCVF